RVSDREDGSLGSGRIPARRVAVRAQYLPDGSEGRAGASPADQGRQLIEGGDCLSCHQLSRKSIGPAYRDVARKSPLTTRRARGLARRFAKADPACGGRSRCRRIPRSAPSRPPRWWRTSGVSPTRRKYPRPPLSPCVAPTRLPRARVTARAEW